ncbi:nucleoside hydrolase [Nakamurella deserti]|uniref:nucleoside hydrolase n=1 Tax=Nakamurella deserti TaxID=2164074 RepID=UPI000DBE8752|nr:nucleoside hydrolase [Nakamurella deserti]
MTRTVIIDCDPGHDDALALFAAFGSPELEVAAVTTVCGNQTVDLVTRNALAVVEVAGRTGSVVVARGAQRPLTREHVPATGIHGPSGLDGPALPVAPGEIDPRPADQVIVDLVTAAGAGAVTLVATGPLTNLALALRREPAIADLVAEVVIMGGAATQGNITPSAEFNIHVDPEAAAAVFDAGWPVTMMGLKVTHQALATAEVRARLSGLGTRVGRFSADLLDFFAERYLVEQGFEHPPVHDLCPVVYLVDPTVFTVTDAPIAVETAGALTAGRTVVDLRGPAPLDCRHRIGLGLDRDRFWDLVMAALARLDGK